MSERLTDRKERTWARFHVACAFLFTIYYLFNPLNIYLWTTVRYTYCLLLIPLFVGAYYLFRRLDGGPEIRLVTYYTVWFFITRLLNGEIWLQTQMEFDTVCELALCAVILPAGLLLNDRGRRTLLNWLSFLMGLFLFVYGVVGIYVFFTRISVYNPLTEATVAAIAPLRCFAQLNVADQNPNISAFLYFIGSMLLVYQFFSCKRKLWRVPIVLALAVFYLIIAFTFSRNVMINTSLAAAMLIILLLRRRFPLRKLWAQGLLILVVLGLVIPLGMMSFNLVASTASRIIYATVPDDRFMTEEEYRAVMGLPPRDPRFPLEEDEVIDEDTFVDSRDFFNDMKTLTARDKIYKGALLTVRKEPVRLLRGSLFEHLMDIVNPTLISPHVHMHNYLLQVLGLAGLPGFLLVLAFSVLFVIRMIRVFFSGQAELTVQLLTLPLTGYFLYGMLEVPMFGLTDERAYLFFLIAGLFLGWSYEMTPPTREKWPGLLRRRPKERSEKNGNS